MKTAAVVIVLMALFAGWLYAGTSFTGVMSTGGVSFDKSFNGEAVVWQTEAVTWQGDAVTW